MSDKHQIFSSAQKFAAQFAGFLEAAKAWEDVLLIEQRVNEAEQRIATLRSEQDELSARAEQVRQAADDYDKKTRSAADSYAGGVESNARAAAGRIHDEAVAIAASLRGEAEAKAERVREETQESLRVLRDEITAAAVRLEAINKEASAKEAELQDLSATIVEKNAEHARVRTKHAEFLAGIGAR
jgi:chromosome segregation ATPase